MTQEVSYLRVLISAQVTSDTANKHILSRAFVDEMLHAFGTNRMTQQFPNCEY